MANRDYVRKKPAPSKKNNNRNQRKSAQRKKPTARAIPWKTAILALILLSGLLALLFMLNSDPEPTQATVVPIAPASTPEQKKKTETLPPPPEEQWDYMKSLPEREIQVEAKEVEVPKIPYIMQCGAYKSKAQAEERKANIAFQGLTSKIVKLEGSSWYRVILGTYTFKRDAVKEQHVLQRAKIEPCIIMRDTLK